MSRARKGLAKACLPHQSCHCRSMGRGGRCAEEIGKPVGLKVEPEEGGVRSVWAYDRQGLWDLRKMSKRIAVGPADENDCRSGGDWPKPGVSLWSRPSTERRISRLSSFRMSATLQKRSCQVERKGVFMDHSSMFNFDISWPCLCVGCAGCGVSTIKLDQAALESL